MSYEYNKLAPSTIQYKKQTPIINTLTHMALSVDQIQIYENQVVCIEDIAELYQNGRPTVFSQDQFNNYVFKISQSCFQNKKLLVAPFTLQMQEYLRTATEYTKYINIYIDASIGKMNIQQFYFLYRKVAKMNKVEVIIRAQDLFLLY